MILTKCAGDNRKERERENHKPGTRFIVFYMYRGVSLAFPLLHPASPWRNNKGNRRVSYVGLQSGRKRDFEAGLLLGTWLLHACHCPVDPMYTLKLQSQEPKPVHLVQDHNYFDLHWQIICKVEASRDYVGLDYLKLNLQLSGNLVPIERFHEYECGGCWQFHLSLEKNTFPRTH